MNDKHLGITHKYGSIQQFFWDFWFVKILILVWTDLVSNSSMTQTY
jgi:hypothetical protein